MKKVKGLSRKKKNVIDNSMVITTGKARWEEGKGGLNGDGRRLGLGW